MKKSSNASAGFTLIELVIVITIIAILAALALPRYAALQQQARIAKVQALTGSVRAAAAIAKAACLADLGTGSPGTCTTAGGTVSMEGTAITMLNQYPVANSSGTGITAAAQLSAANDGVVLSTAGAGVAAVTTIQVSGATCQLTYQGPAVAGNSPTVVVTTTGC